MVAKEIEPDTDSTKTRSGEDYSEKDKEKKKWECSSECKPVTAAEVGIILQLKAAFEMPLEDVRHALDHCDEGCPNGHYTLYILTLLTSKAIPWFVLIVQGANVNSEF